MVILPRAAIAVQVIRTLVSLRLTAPPKGGAIWDKGLPRRRSRLAMTWEKIFCKAKKPGVFRAFLLGIEVTL